MDDDETKNYNFVRWVDCSRFKVNRVVLLITRLSKHYEINLRTYLNLSSNNSVNKKIRYGKLKMIQL